MNGFPASVGTVSLSITFITERGTHCVHAVAPATGALSQGMSASASDALRSGYDPSWFPPHHFPRHGQIRLLPGQVWIPLASLSLCWSVGSKEFTVSFVVSEIIGRPRRPVRWVHFSGRW